MKYVTPTLRILFGLAFVVFGLNLFLNFIPQPETPMDERAMAFAGALAASGYMMPFIGVTQLVCGLLLVVNRFVPLALAVLAAFLANSLAFHLALEKTGLVNSLIFVAIELYLAWAYRSAFRPMLRAKVQPG